MKKNLLSGGLLLLLTACNGVEINLEQEFQSVKLGDSVKEVLFATHSVAPFYEETFDFAGFQFIRQEFRDTSSVYAVYFASTPLSEAKVIAKSESRQNFMKALNN